MIVNIFRNANREAHEWCIQEDQGWRVLELGLACNVAIKNPEFVVDPERRALFEKCGGERPVTHAWLRGELYSIGEVLKIHKHGGALHQFIDVPPPLNLGPRVDMQFDRSLGKFLPEDVQAEFAVIIGREFFATLLPVQNSV